MPASAGATGNQEQEHIFVATLGLNPSEKEAVDAFLGKRPATYKGY